MILMPVFSGRDTCVVMAPQTQQHSGRLIRTSLYGGMTQRSTSHACWNNAAPLCGYVFNESKFLKIKSK